MNPMRQFLARLTHRADQRQAAIREATGGFSPNYTSVFLSVFTGLPLDETLMDPLLYVKLPEKQDEP